MDEREDRIPLGNDIWYGRLPKPRCGVCQSESIVGAYFFSFTEHFWFCAEHREQIIAEGEAQKIARDAEIARNADILGVSVDGDIVRKGAC